MSRIIGWRVLAVLYLSSGSTRLGRQCDTDWKTNANRLHILVTAVVLIVDFRPHAEMRM